MDERCEARFRIVTAAHHLISNGVPFRDPDSQVALTAFLKVDVRRGLPSPELEAVLLRTLALLDRHSGGRLPTMVERYLSADFARSTMLRRFQECVTDVLRYRGIAEPLVQRAIAIIENRYSDSRLTANAVADMLRTQPGTLAAAFNAQTGMNSAEYLRNLRLNRAAALLVGKGKTVKEVWVAVGYNHASNFDHDFRERFGESPSQYRARGICTPSTGLDRDQPLSSETPTHRHHVNSRASVLIIDDDAGTRETIGRYLRLEGNNVTVAASGEEGLREAERTRLEAVLLDYHLPDFDGLHWLSEFRRRHHKTRVVLFSADWDLEWKLDELTALGATFLSKLCDLVDVRKALDDARS